MLLSGLGNVYDTLGARDFSSAVSGFCQVFAASAYGRRYVGLRPTPKISPHARKTSGTQGMSMTPKTKNSKNRYVIGSFSPESVDLS